MASSPPSSADGPLKAYRRLVEEGDLAHDSQQELAAEKLQMLHNRLKDYEPDGGLFAKLFRREGQDAPSGLYLYGGVGRGKSMLMDLFYETTGFTPKRRVHFHAFMLEVHETINRWRKLPEKERRARGFTGDDPLPPLARQIAEDARLLCFDEFQVTDVADAMILGRLFRGLFDEGVVMVITSNRAPDGLYEGGLNRQLFEPAIDMLKRELDLLHLATPTDYRMERIMGSPVYHCPLGRQAERELDEAFTALTDEKSGEPLEIKVAQGRTLKIGEAAKGVARASFDELCARALGASDYIALAESFHTLILSGIPALSRDKRNEAKRFVTLIDTLYENRVKLICSAEVEPAELYTEGDGSFEFQRTVSRLMEMQSHDWFQVLEAAEGGATP